MKRLRIFVFFLALAPLTGAVHASETSDLLADRLPKMSSGNQEERKQAQQDWMQHCLRRGNDPAVRTEICRLTIERLGRDLPVDTSVWLIRQLGYLGDDSAIPALTKLLESGKKRVADEAARALANIGSKKAESALAESATDLARGAISDIKVDRDVLKKAGNETVMPLAIPYADENAVAEWMKGYDRMDDDGKARTLANLAVRRDGRFIPQALEALKSDNANLRDVAIAAVGAMGSSRQIPVLLELAFSDATREQAKEAISRMNDRMLDARLIGVLSSEKDANRFATIADILKRRSNAAALPVILERACGPDCPNRVTLLQIAETFASKDDLGSYVKAWELISDRQQKDQAEQMIARIAGGDSESVTKYRNEANHAAMFSLLGRIGDEKSLKEIRDRVFDRPPEDGMKATASLKAAALRAMCNWPDGRVAEDLFKLVRDNNVPESDRIAALRAYARVVSLPSDRIRIPVDEKGKVALLAKAMPMATRKEEKELILQRAGQVRDPDSLRFIMEYFDDPELRHRVCLSVVDLAHHTGLRDSDKKAFADALDKVLAESKDKDLLNRAKRYRDAMK